MEFTTPRQYAAAILKMNPEIRDRAYQRVPQEWLELIKSHVRCWDETQDNQPERTDIAGPGP